MQSKREIPELESEKNVMIRRDAEGQKAWERENKFRKTVRNLTFAGTALGIFSGMNAMRQCEGDCGILEQSQTMFTNTLGGFLGAVGASMIINVLQVMQAAYEDQLETNKTVTRPKM